MIKGFGGTFVDQAALQPRELIHQPALYTANNLS